jgi:Rod binding domain-containing protein
MDSPLLSAMTPLSGSPTPLSGHTPDTPEKIHEAASQFEAILIGQILKTTQGANGEGWLGDNEDQAAGSTVDFATDFFAKALAAQGGLGLSHMISTSLERASNSKSAIPNQSLADSSPKE